MQEDTQTVIVISEEGENGVVEITGKDREQIQKAIEIIKSIAIEPEVGEVYEGKIVAIKDFGAFVEIGKGTEGLLHISEIDWKRTNDVNDVFKIGDKVKVKLIGMENNGKLRFSRKILLPKPEGYKEPERRERRPSNRGSRPGRNQNQRRPGRFNNNRDDKQE